MAKAWIVPEGYVSMAEASRLCKGWSYSSCASKAIELNIIKRQGKGKPALIKKDEVELLVMAMAELLPKKINGGDRRKGSKSKVKETIRESNPPVSSPQTVVKQLTLWQEFEVTARKLIHLCKMNNISVLTIDKDGCEYTRTIQKEITDQIKG
jgi:hypothetical protein